MSHSTQFPNDINRAVHSLGRALLLGTSIEHWKGVALIFMARLTVEERLSVTYAALRSLEPDEAAQVFEFACPSAGYPPPTLDNVMHDARWWASFAIEDELKAYSVAVYEAMSPEGQAAFLEWASQHGRRAA
ncbi:MAG: hypothetical protein AAF636_26940 [Pseudomonadota bacterium]